MKFKGGIHPKYNKLTADMAVVPLPLGSKYVVPVSQHIGAPGEVIVERGQVVGRGQPLTQPRGFVSVAVHAPTSGTVKKIAEYPHPMGRPQMAIEIEADGEDRWFEELGEGASWRETSPDDLKSAIADAGIVGMGGAAFPTHVKLSPPADKKIDLLILNGAECEPYLTSDHRVMVENAADVMEGIGIMMKILSVEKALIGIESNKPDAKTALEAVCPADLNISVHLLETKYPQGSEKHLIKAMSGREVPSGCLPMDAGCVVQNVGTAAACFEAISVRRPMTERIVTVTGGAIGKPQNISARIGTPLSEVLEFCGGLDEKVGKVIYGGPMMGMVQFNFEVPVCKGTSGILCLREEELTQFVGGPCIRCGNCVDVCPMFLIPSNMSVLIERSVFDTLGEHNINDCIECGSCAYVCPSQRPLVHYFKRGKLEWREVLKAREAE